MIAKTEKEIESLRKGGKILADALRATAQAALPGVSTAELDLLAEKFIRDNGCIPAFLNYQPDGAAYPFPATLCTSLNDEVVHGIPNDERVLADGDVLKLDLGLSYEGFFVDSAITVLVGECDMLAKKLVDATRAAIDAAISAAQVGGRVGDIGAAVEKSVLGSDFSIVDGLCGHAVGKSVHEQPLIPNEGRVGTGEKLVEGMVLALEPMLAEGRAQYILAPDQWTCVMADGKRAAQFEHTILLTKNGPEILTL